jgi:hypothetical protein
LGGAVHGDRVAVVSGLSKERVEKMVELREWLNA